MADNQNELAVESGQNDEKVVDYNHECIEKVNNCHEVLFGGSEERQKSIIKLILQYLI